MSYCPRFHYHVYYAGLYRQCATSLYDLYKKGSGTQCLFSPYSLPSPVISCLGRIVEVLGGFGSPSSLVSSFLCAIPLDALVLFVKLLVVSVAVRSLFHPKVGRP
jgi:hypothetical protein